MKKLLLAILFVGAFLQSDAQKKQTNYFGQKLPQDEPELFAPGIVNDGISTRDIAFTPDSKEIYFGKNIGNSSYATFFYCKKTKTGWSEPKILPFATDPKYIFIEPFVSSDGQKLFFVSNRGNEFSPHNRFITDIWVAEREGNFWGQPKKLDSTINSKESEFFPTVAENGNLYFTRENQETREGYIYKSEFKNGKYQPAVKLPDQINAGAARFNATISRDESFIIVPIYGLKDSYGATDYYVSFFDEQNGWSEPINLGSKINTPGGNEYSASFSPDGKYFFFMSSRTRVEQQPEFNYKNFRELHNKPENGNSCIYWMKSDFIIKLKEKAIFTEN